MLAASNCDCLICRLEICLIAELNEDHAREQFRLFALSSPILSSFPTALELVRTLHDHVNHERNPTSDEVLLDLLKRSGDTPFRPMWQRLLLLVFIPTVHRTTSQIAANFPSLTRDDTAQYLFAVLLEFLHSKELRSRESHLAFTIARKIRRNTFRWAIRESRRAMPDSKDGTPATWVQNDVDDADVHADILLQQFLDNCQRRGRLTAEERELLTEFKLEGLSGSELARRNGHSAIAIRHRIQRVLARLRRIAQAPKNRTPEQLLLFPP
jgi:DNA-directed RNA polymerase specialized sigma24 family protein